MAASLGGISMHLEARIREEGDSTRQAHCHAIYVERLRVSYITQNGVKNNNTYARKLELAPLYLRACVEKKLPTKGISERGLQVSLYRTSLIIATMPPP